MHGHMTPQAMGAMPGVNPMMAGAPMFNPMFMQQMAANPLLMQQMAAAQMQMAAMQQQQQQAAHGPQANGMPAAMGGMGMGGMGMNPMGMNPMLQMMHMQQLMMQQQQQQQHSMARPMPGGGSSLNQPALPSAGMGGPMPFNPMMQPMYNPMMAQQQQQQPHAVSGPSPGMAFHPSMQHMQPLPSPAAQSQSANGMLPSPPGVSPQPSPTSGDDVFPGSGSATGSPAPAVSVAPDAFAALDAQSGPLSLPDLPGAPLNIKTAKQTSTTVSPPSKRPTPQPASAAASRVEAESEFGDFETAKATPTLQPSLPPQQFAVHGQQLPHMQQPRHMQQPHMTPQQFQFMQQQLYLQQQQQMQLQHQTRSPMMFPLPSTGVAPGVTASAAASGNSAGSEQSDFGGFSSAIASPTAPVGSPAPVAPSVREISFDPPAVSSDDADFGGFESASATEATPASSSTNAATDDDFEADFQHAEPPSTIESLSAPSQHTSASEPIATPVAAASMDSLLHSALDKAFDSNKANAPLVDVPPTAALNAMQPHNRSVAGAANNQQVHKGRVLPSELDDLLNSLLPDAVAHDAPLPTLPFDDRRAAQQVEQDELEFDDFSSATVGMDQAKQGDSAAKASSNSATAGSGNSNRDTAAVSVEDEDDFADFTAASEMTTRPSTALSSGGDSGSGAGSESDRDRPQDGRGKGGAGRAGKGTKADSSPASAEEQQIAAAIAAAAKKKGGSFAFSAQSAAATMVTVIAPPSVSPHSFGPPPPISIVSLSALVPPPLASPSPAPVLFDVTAVTGISAEEDDFDADFEQSAPAAATPFGVGLPSLMGGGGGTSQEAYFDEEDENTTDTLPPSNLQAPSVSPSQSQLSTSSSTSLGGRSASELSEARKNSISTPSARSTPAPAFDLLDDSNHNSNGTAVSSSSQSLSLISADDLGRAADGDEFAGFASADSSLQRPASTVPVTLSVAIPVSPTAIPPPSPTPSLPSPSASLAALSSLFAFPPLPLPLPLSLSSPQPSDASTSPSSALSMLLSQDRFAEWQLLSAHLKATEQLPALQAQYKEAIAASMDDEEQLSVAMALQVRIKKLKAIQPIERWMRPLTFAEQLEGDGGVPSLSYTQLVTLLSAVNIGALPAFSANFPQPFAAALQQPLPAATGDESSLVQAAARHQYRANIQLRSVVGLLPCHQFLFVSRAARVWSHIASQLAAGVAFVTQVAQLEAGNKKDSRLTAALATASSFLTSLAALYRVHLRLALARHTYQWSEPDGSGSSSSSIVNSAAAVEQSWAAIKRGLTKGPWKSAADKSHKQLAAVLAALEVDSAAEWQQLAVTGQAMADTCELCLGRLEGGTKERTAQMPSPAAALAEGGTVSLHQLCANLWRNAEERRGAQ